MIASQESSIDVLKMRVDRISLDMDSEKADRSRVNGELFRRIDESDKRTAEKIDEVRDAQNKSDRILYMVLGGLAVVEFLSRFVGK